MNKKCYSFQQKLGLASNKFCNELSRDSCTWSETNSRTNSTTDDQLRALIITSKFDSHQGAIAYVRVVNGELSKKELYLSFSKTKFLPIEIGVFTPEKEKRNSLRAGEVGYLATGLKDISLLKVGDTITSFEDKEAVTVLPGYKEPTPMVFMEIYPVDSKDFSNLKDAMAKLTMHDSALQYQATHSIALGNGLRVGFLGIFHAELFAKD
jgi:GTP-binding protein LepA